MEELKIPITITEYNNRKKDEDERLERENNKQHKKIANINAELSSLITDILRQNPGKGFTEHEIGDIFSPTYGRERVILVLRNLAHTDNYGWATGPIYTISSTYYSYSMWNWLCDFTEKLFICSKSQSLRKKFWK